jgi:hypothetical protein
MASYLLCHRHEPDECRAAFSAWQGFDSSLRHERAYAGCVAGDHRVWWRVEAASAEDALSRLPAFVAERTEVAEVREVMIP